MMKMKGKASKRKEKVKLGLLAEVRGKGSEEVLKAPPVIRSVLHAYKG